MPAIQTVQRAGGVRYRFTLSLGRDPATGNRRQRVYTFDDEKQAEQERARLTGQLADGRFTDRTAATVNDALDAYLASALFEREAATAVSYTGALLPVRERLGRRKLQSLTRADVEALRDWLLPSGRRRGGTPGTGPGRGPWRSPWAASRPRWRWRARTGGWPGTRPSYVRPPRQHGARARRGPPTSSARSSTRPARTGWPPAGG